MDAHLTTHPSNVSICLVIGLSMSILLETHLNCKCEARQASPSLTFKKEWLELNVQLYTQFISPSPNS